MVSAPGGATAPIRGSGCIKLGQRIRLGRRTSFAAVAMCVAWLAFSNSAFAQNVPAPSQVVPPVIAPPVGGGRISIPQVPAGAQIPPEAKKLFFKLLGFDISGEFREFAAKRKAIEAPLVGRKISVAQVFEFADQLQQVYAKAGYPLVRVVLLPQEFQGAARIKLRIIDGFVERLDYDHLPWQVQRRVAAVLAPLLHKTHLQQAELERQLLIAGEAPGLVLNATFAPGKQLGGSVLVLSGRYRPISASLYIDNDMPAVFGTGQGVVSVSANSLFGLGDQLTLQAAGLPDHTFGTSLPERRYFSGSFSIPLGINGWKFEIGGVNGLTTPHVDPALATKGFYSEGYAKISYEVLKRRDYELTLNERLDAADQEIETLAITPLSEDRVRALRTGVDGIWRGRQTGTTIIYGGNYSRGLDTLGARTAADATFLLPLSRQGADAVFDKVDGHIEIDQSLPQDFFANFYAAGQDSFHRALLTSEQFDIDGARYLSGFTAGALPGDTAWVTRGEFGHAFTTQLPKGPDVVWSPYLFGGTGERLLEDPTVLEVPSVHAVNYGVGLRFNVLPPSNEMPTASGFVEYSHRTTNEVAFNGDRIFAGMLLQY